MSLDRIVTRRIASLQRSVGKFVCQNPLHYEWGSCDGLAKAICRQSVLSVLTDKACQRGSLVKVVRSVCSDCQASADDKGEVLTRALYTKVRAKNCSRCQHDLLLFFFLGDICI